MSYWIFKANPDQWIDDRLRDLSDNLIWAVTRYHDRIKKGDLVFIWRSNSPRGICAVMEIDQCPYEPKPDELKNGFKMRSKDSGVNLAKDGVVPSPDHWAKGRLTLRFPLIEMSVIKKIPGLELFSFFSAFQQAINFTLTRPEGSILMEYIELHKNDEEKPEMAPRQSTAKPVVKSRNSDPQRGSSVHSSHENKTKAGTPARTSVPVVLMQCGECNRYVVSSDTERHGSEDHPGVDVHWKKAK